MRRIKLIWDFRGADALETARHHQIHLDEFTKREKIENTSSGIEELSKDSYSIAFVIVDEKDMLKVRDALKPHRGELAQ